jgi:hypothetical protein
MALNVDSEPSGAVPGAGDEGHYWSSLLLGCGGGPDCVFQHLRRVFSIKDRDLVIIFVFSLFPFVLCTRRCCFNGI